jgi:hypothetical protein
VTKSFSMVPGKPGFLFLVVFFLFAFLLAYISVPIAPKGGR